MAFHLARLHHGHHARARLRALAAGDSGSVLTINQGIPLQGVANATISIETMNMSVDLEALLDKLRMVDGVKRLEVLGQAQA